MPDRPLVGPNRKPRALGALHPNAGLSAAYRRRLDALIEEMHRSLVRWLTATWRDNPPALAQDTAASDLIEEMNRLGQRWMERFDSAAPLLAEWFGRSVRDRSDNSLRAVLRRAGISVRFEVTPEVQDVLDATIGAQVGLIRSIASEHLEGVQGAVMRSVQTGRDLGTLTKELRERYGVTKRRAARIALSQNNIATATITRTRQQELGITQARWLHSGGGRHPRQEHVEFSRGKRGGPVYEVAKGAFLEGRWTWPGVEPGCRCVSRPIIEGFS